MCGLNADPYETRKPWEYWAAQQEQRLRESLDDRVWDMLVKRLEEVQNARTIETL